MTKTHFLIPATVLLTLAASMVLATAIVSGQSPDFNISSTPVSSCVNPGDSSTYVITVSGTDGFQGTVSIGDTISPDSSNGPTLSAIPSSVDLAAGQSAKFQLTASTSATTTKQVYTITIIGVYGSTVHSTDIYLAFQPACFSAGATVLPVNFIALLAPYAGLALSTTGLALAVAFYQTRRSRARI